MQIRPASPLQGSEHPESQSPPTSNVPSPLPIRIITHNIRYAAGYWSRFPLEPAWQPTRHHLLTSQMRFLTRPHFAPPHTVVFLQEVLHQQFVDIQNRTFPSSAGWQGLGVGREDGKKAGEHEAVFFRTDAWTLVHWETRWLNEDGAVGEKGWDAASVRTATCVVLDTKRDFGPGPQRRRVLFINAHLDDQGVVSRIEGAKLLLRILDELKERFRPSYWVLGGDFNSPKQDGAYETTVAKGTGLVDAREALDGWSWNATDTETGVEDGDAKPSGQEGATSASGSVEGGGQYHTTSEWGDDRWGEFMTYTGFDGIGEKNPKEVQRIDFLFVPDTKTDAASPGSAEKGVVGYAVIPNSFEGSKDGRVSDHRAVMVDLLA